MGEPGPSPRPAAPRPAAGKPPAARPPAVVQVTPVAKPPPRHFARLRRVLTYWFPPTSTRPRRTDGLQSEPGPEWLGWAIALFVGILAAWIYASVANVGPIPPGGDPSQWLLLAYPYVGLATAPQVQLLSYPPVSFPILGVFVLLGHGPLQGARLYVEAITVLIGVSMYHLGRSMFRFRAVALLAEIGFLLQPDFMQLYYFGAYPNLLGFAFFFLAVSFGLRFLRSRSQWHLAWFWGSLTAAVLCHALVAVLLVGLVAAAFAILLLYRRVPRELFTKPAGAIGLAIFAACSLLYYEGTIFFKVNAPNYLSTSALTSSKSTELLQATVKPLYLEILAKFFDGSGFPNTYQFGLQVIWELLIAIVVAFLLARVLVPKDVSHRVVLIGAWFISVFGVALLTWYIGLSADYRRFAYFLYPPLILLFGLGADVVFLYLWDRGDSHKAPPESAVPSRVRLRDAWRWRRWDRRQGLITALVAAGCVFMIFAADDYTIPTAQAYAQSFQGPGHDQNFVTLMQDVTNSGISGAILSLTATVDRWPATLSARNLYETRSPTGYTYTTENLVQDELSTMTATYRYTVTNGLVEAGIPGITPNYFTAAPTYSGFIFGVPEHIFKINPGAVYITVQNQSERSIWAKSPTVQATMILPSNPNNSTMEVVYNGSGYSVVETITALPGTSTMSIVFTATATTAAPLVKLRLTVGNASNGNNTASSVDPSSFGWFTNTSAGNLSTSAGMMPGGVVTGVVAGYPGGSGSVDLATNATTPQRTLTLGFTATTLGASNTASGLGGFYSTPATWSSWNIRFILFYNGSYSGGITELAYLETEYGVTIFAQKGPWTMGLIARIPSQ